MVNVDPARYDRYITGTTPIERLKCMKWSKTIFIKMKIDSISSEIEKDIQIKKSEWSYSLIHKAFYLTTTLTLGLVGGALLQYFIYKKKIKSFKFLESTPFLFGAGLLSPFVSILEQQNRTNELKVKEAVCLQYQQKEPDLYWKIKDYFRDYKKNIETLNQILQRCSTLGPAANHDVVREVNNAIDSAKTNIEIIKQIPRAARDIMLSDKTQHLLF